MWLDFEEHSICGTTCKHAHPFVESPRDIDRRESGLSTYRIWWDRESSTAYLACRSARRILLFTHHAPWTAGKRKAQPFDPARRSATRAWRKLSSARIGGFVYYDLRTREEERFLNPTASLTSSKWLALLGSPAQAYPARAAVLDSGPVYGKKVLKDRLLHVSAFEIVLRIEDQGNSEASFVIV